MRCREDRLATAMFELCKGSLGSLDSQTARFQRLCMSPASGDGIDRRLLETLGRFGQCRVQLEQSPRVTRCSQSLQLSCRRITPRPSTVDGCLVTLNLSGCQQASIGQTSGTDQTLVGQLEPPGSKIDVPIQTCGVVNQFTIEVPFAIEPGQRDSQLRRLGLAGQCVLLDDPVLPSHFLGGSGCSQLDPGFVDRLFDSGCVEPCQDLALEDRCAV